MRRGVTPVAIARDAAALAEATFPEPDALRRHATIDEEASLDRALHGAQAVINCAGPFIDTADAIASAALRARIHYLDVCAEQGSAEKTLEKFDEPARQAGVAVVPSMAFYGGLPDLMATAALGDWAGVDSITRGDERRRATVRGRDIYAISAPLVCEAVERLLVGKFSATGAHAPGEIFDAGDILAALGPDNSTFEVFAA